MNDLARDTSRDLEVELEVALDWIDLEPGRYVARFVRSVDSPGEIYVSFF